MKLGLIAGGGDVVLEIIEFLSQESTSLRSVCFVCKKPLLGQAFGQKHIPRKQNFTSRHIPITKTQKILNLFKESDVDTICIIGSFSMPNLLSLIPDKAGAELLRRIINLEHKGDDAVLKEVIKFLEEKGFKVVGAHKVMPSLLVNGSINTEEQFTVEQNVDIQLAVKFLESTSHFDVGQSVAVHNGRIIAFEGFEGTDRMIKRCKESGKKGIILVKMAKNNQDLRVDMPTFGAKTIELLAKNNFAGIAIKASAALVVNLQKTKRLAEKKGVIIKVI